MRFFLLLAVPVQAGLGLDEDSISETTQPGALSGKVVTLYYDTNDYKGVIRAIDTLGMSELIDRLVTSRKFNDVDLKGKWARSCN